MALDNELERAYASAEQTPYETLEILHSSIAGGAYRIVNNKSDISVTLEDLSNVTFNKSSFTSPSIDKNADGNQSLSFSVDNTNLVPWRLLDSALSANRTSDERVILKFRSYLPSDLTSPAGAISVFSLTSAPCSRVAMNIRATYTPIPDITFPKKRYLSTVYTGLKYAF